MKKLQIAFVATLVAVASMTSAQADTIVQTESFAGTPNLSRALTFNQFDNQDGFLSLLSIEVVMDLYALDGRVVLDNDGELPGSGTFTLGASGSIFSTDVALLDASSQPIIAELSAVHSQPFNLAANVGDGPGDWDPSGPDGLQYDGDVESDSGSGLVAQGLFGEYIGTGTFEIGAAISQQQDFDGLSGIEWSISPVNASGNVTVTYEYEAVPEPASILVWSLLCLTVGSVALRRYRRRVA